MSVHILPQIKCSSSKNIKQTTTTKFSERCNPGVCLESRKLSHKCESTHEKITKHQYNGTKLSPEDQPLSRKCRSDAMEWNDPFSYSNILYLNPFKWDMYRKARRCKDNKKETEDQSILVIKSKRHDIRSQRWTNNQKLVVVGRANQVMRIKTSARVPPDALDTSECKRYTGGKTVINLIKNLTKPTSAFAHNARLCIVLIFFCLFINEFSSSGLNHLDSDIISDKHKALFFPPFITPADASLIIGDSAIEIHEVSEPPSSNGENIVQLGDNLHHQDQLHQQQQDQQQKQQEQHVPSQHVAQLSLSLDHGSNHYQNEPNLILGSLNDNNNNNPLKAYSLNQHQPLEQQQQQHRHLDSNLLSKEESQQPKQQQKLNSNPTGPLPPLAGKEVNDKRPLDYHLDDVGNPNDSNQPEKEPSSAESTSSDDVSKSITGKVVDFELTPAGGHNKAKIKKKKKKKMKKEEEQFKKWGKKKKSEKKAMDEKSKKAMKKKKEEGKKNKKKWGKEEHGQKKKGKFKKKKWGKKVKKGKGVKKGKKGKKFLKDKGHKNTGFKTVYHKEEWGKSSKWHDIKREKKWDEKSKKWKKKWKKEKGKKYKGDHMKKFEKKKKSGKKYKKEKAEKFKKEKKEKFEKGMKKKMEEGSKKKEGGAKKEEKKEEKKKKKKKKG